MSDLDFPTLVVESQDPAVAEELRALFGASPDMVSMVETKSFSATHYVLQAMVPLVPTAAGIGGLVATWIRSRRHVSVTVGGISLQGMSAREAERLLTKIVELGDVTAALTELDRGKVGPAGKEESETDEEPEADEEPAA